MAAVSPIDILRASFSAIEAAMILAQTNMDMKIDDIQKQLNTLIAPPSEPAPEPAPEPVPEPAPVPSKVKYQAGGKKANLKGARWLSLPSGTEIKVTIPVLKKTFVGIWDDEKMVINFEGKSYMSVSKFVAAVYKKAPSAKYDLFGAWDKCYITQGSEKVVLRSLRIPVT